MNKISKLLLSSSFGLLLSLPSNLQAAEAKATDRFMYFGIGGGLSTPAVKSFEHKKTKISLGASEMYEVQAGYSFYPNMILEASFAHQPKYKLDYVLPPVNFNLTVPGVGTVPVTTDKVPGKTKVRVDLLFLNLIYQFEPVIASIKPFVIFGGGMARIYISPTSSTSNISTVGGQKITQQETFRVKKSSDNYFAWQAGLGLSTDITENLEIDLAAKLRVVNSAKIKYDTYDAASGQFISQKPIKQTIGVGEFVVTFNYKLPL